MKVHLVTNTPAFTCNQFLVKDPKSNQFDLIDAGIGLDHALTLQRVTQIIDPSRVRNVFVTHEHMDHTGGLPQWQAMGARIHTAPETARKLHEGHDPTSARFGQNIPKMDVDEELTVGGDYSLGGERLEVLRTPGHSPGSLCFWSPDSRVLFTGDTVFAEGGIGRFDFPDSNGAHLLESILGLEALPAAQLHCGHGPSIEGDESCSRCLKASADHARLACR